MRNSWETFATKSRRVVSSRSRETGGTGLGLAIVKHVLNRHQGRLDIQSTPGNGSTFSVLFPDTRRVAADRTTVAKDSAEEIRT